MSDTETFLHEITRAMALPDGGAMPALRAMIDQAVYAGVASRPEADVSAEFLIAHLAVAVDNLAFIFEPHQRAACAKMVGAWVAARIAACDAA